MDFVLVNKYCYYYACTKSAKKYVTANVFIFNLITNEMLLKYYDTVVSLSLVTLVEELEKNIRTMMSSLFICKIGYVRNC